MGYGRPYLKLIIFTLILIITTTGLSLITPLILRDLIDNIIPQENVRGLVISAVLLLLIPLVRGMLLVLQRWLNARIGEGVIYDLRVALYAHLQRMSLHFFTNTRIGELMSRLNNDVVGAQTAISSTLVDIVTNFIQAIAVLAVMFKLDWRLTLISVAIFPLFIIVARQMGVRLRNIARKQMDMNAQMYAMMNETLNIGGALLVKLFGRTDTEVDRFSNRAAHVRDMGIERSLIAGIFIVTVGLVSAVGTALVYGFGGYLAILNVFSIGTIVAFAAYLNSLYQALQGLANAPVAFSTSVVSFERVFEVLDLPMDIKEKPEAIVLQGVRGELIFDDVTFRYQGSEGSALKEVQRFGQVDKVQTVLSGDGYGDKERKTTKDNSGKDFGELEHEKQSPVLDDERVNINGENLSSQAREVALENVNIRVKPGQLVALVGPSGAGKTTLTYLIPRLYDPTEGRILIDGHDLQDVTLASLSAQIGMVTQESYLFHDTIRTNLLYAKPNANQGEIENAARIANIHEFIMELPEQYETIVGERGYRLSGGEKQRIALARVILKNPHILVLDEATSNLDSESEALIQESLKHVMADRTSIVIAHRLSTILAADQILVMDRGHIVERGTHEELLKAQGMYAHLYHTQFNRGDFTQ
jgi:ATP-binding cassette subfamily B protein